MRPGPSTTQACRALPRPENSGSENSQAPYCGARKIMLARGMTPALQLETQFCVLVAGFERGASVPGEDLDDASALPKESVECAVVVDPFVAGLHAVVRLGAQDTSESIISCHRAISSALWACPCSTGEAKV